MISAYNIISCFGRLGRRVAAITLGAVLVASCADDSFIGDGPADPRAGFITIDLMSNSVASRADGTEAGDNDLHENLITKALVCLMPAAAANDTDKPVYMRTFTVDKNAPASDPASVSIRLDRELISNLFGESTTARAYVIANLPASTTIPADPTLADLQALKVSSDFASNQPQPSFVMDGWSDLTLTADPVDLTKSYVTGEVHLVRSAAKIVLGVKMAESVKDAYGNDWVPVASTLGVLINNGVRRSAVNPSTHTLASGDYFSTSNEHTNPIYHQRGFTRLEGDDVNFPYVLTQPFYTYPNSWADDHEKMTYMTLVMQWSNGSARRTCYYMVPVVRSAEALVRNVSYRVNISLEMLGNYTPDDPLELEDVSYRAVDWGKEEVNVEIDDFRYLVLDRNSFEVNNEAIVNIPFYSSHPVTVTNTKVTYYLYNFSDEGNEEPVEITSDQNQRSTTTFEGNDLTHIYETTVDNNINSVTASRTLTFNHPLYQWDPYDLTNNPVVLNGTVNSAGNMVYPSYSLNYLLSTINYYRRTNDQSFSRYEIEITIVQTDKINEPDEDTYTEKIKITQYPGMYIKADHNPGASYAVRTTNASGNNNNYGVANYGYAFVNAARTTYANGGVNYIWECVTFGGLLRLEADASNKNPNMYITTISQLDAQAGGYMIADPRLEAIDNLNNENAVSSDAANWCNSANDMNGNSRTLSFYHPTSESDKTKMMVAPKLRIASSFAEMQRSISKFDCKRRCATYQERGYPAGRWRVPTYGELKYIVELTLSGKIPKLFNFATTASPDDGRYLTAQGVYQVDAATGELKEYTGTTTKFYVRPVYDEWYWTDELKFDSSQPVGLQYVYTYGDKE